MEWVIDVIILIKILLTPFIAVEQKKMIQINGSGKTSFFECRVRKLFLAYAKSYLVFELISVLPGIIVSEKLCYEDCQAGKNTIL